MWLSGYLPETSAVKLEIEGRKLGIRSYIQWGLITEFNGAVQAILPRNIGGVIDWMRIWH